MPGQSVLTRTPNGARSLAAHWAKLMTAALAALYGGSVCEPIWPATDERKSIDRDDPAASLDSYPGPKSPRPRVAGANAWATFTAPSRLTLITRSQSAGSSFQNGKPNLPDPAPTAKTTWSHRSKRRAISSATRTTAAIVGHVGYQAMRMREVAEPRLRTLGSRSTAATRDRSAANARAIAAPIPRAAPKTATTLPARPRSTPIASWKKNGRWTFGWLAASFAVRQPSLFGALTAGLLIAAANIDHPVAARPLGILRLRDFREPLASAQRPVRPTPSTFSPTCLYPYPCGPASTRAAWSGFPTVILRVCSDWSGSASVSLNRPNPAIVVIPVSVSSSQ